MNDIEQCLSGLCNERDTCCNCDGAGCSQCGDTGWMTIEHCCVCGGSPYCTCCRTCGADCIGSCRCPVTVTLQDGTTKTIAPVESEEERDWYQEYKDDLAMGRINRDGTQLDAEPPDAYWSEGE